MKLLPPFFTCGSGSGHSGTDSGSNKYGKNADNLIYHKAKREYYGKEYGYAKE
jgi:hypothetical protein